MFIIYLDINYAKTILKKTLKVKNTSICLPDQKGFPKWMTSQ